MCRRHRLAHPKRQVKRRDADGRVRFTDCEWSLPDGRVLVLEVDGSFHMGAQQWEDDVVRQRALSAPDRAIVRCTAHELREDSGAAVARDLRRLGVPSAA
jgi:very-short-patch-repair endonuclease